LVCGNLTDLEAWFVIFGSPAATIGAAVLIVIFTPLIAAMAYFRRKEYETVRQRYLDGCLEKIIKQVEHGLNIFEFNWAHSIHLLRTYKDVGSNMSPKSYINGFAEFDKQTSLEASSHYLLTDLIGDGVYWHVHQLLTAFLHEADNFFKEDLCTAIRVSIEGPQNGTIIDTPEKIFTAYVEELAKKRLECHPFYIFLGNLQLLATQLLKKQYHLKNLKNFRDKPEVISTVKSLKETFKEDLTKYSDTRTSDEEVKE